MRIPRALAAEVGVGEGTTIEIVARGDAILLSKPRYSLDELLAGVRRDNLHGEIDAGGPAGREAW